MAVFVLDKRKKPLMPCTEKRARLLLERRRAVVHSIHPFTIRLKDRTAEESELQPIKTKIDPGSKTTGLAIVRVDEDNNQHVLWLGDLDHRGDKIRDQMTQRRGFRRRRRGKNLRYRAPRFNNRVKPEGWLPPSLQHRVDTTKAWVEKFQKRAPVTGIAMELARFDTQALENPGISGAEYQRGTLFATEVWEYLLEAWGRSCAYCGARNVPLERDHILPRSKGGSDRVDNLTLACRPCNQVKGNQPVEEFLARKPARLRRIQARGGRKSLRDAAALNTTRQAVLRALEGTGLPVETATGGRTKWNRQRFGIPKVHALDAACVGVFGELHRWQVPTLRIRAMGRGSYKRTRLTKHGFPRGYLTRQKQVHGFQTGDHVHAIVPEGVHAGIHTGRVAVRATGSFNIQTANGVIQGVNHRHCRILQRNDGYGYSFTPTQKGRESDSRASHGALSSPPSRTGFLAQTR